MNAGAPFVFYDQVTLPAFPGEVLFDFSRLSSLAREPLMITSIIFKAAFNAAGLRNSATSGSTALVRMSVGRHPITSGDNGLVPLGVLSPVRTLQGSTVTGSCKVLLQKPLIVLPGVALSAAMRQFDGAPLGGAIGAASIAIHGNFLPHGYVLPGEFWIPYVAGWRNGPIATPTWLASPEGELQNELEKDLVCDYLTGCWWDINNLAPFGLAPAEQTRASTIRACYEKLNLCPSHTPWQVFFNLPQRAFGLNEFVLPPGRRIFVETAARDGLTQTLAANPAYVMAGLVGRRKEAF